jgi:hypothetical protein
MHSAPQPLRSDYRERCTRKWRRSRQAPGERARSDAASAARPAGARKSINYSPLIGSAQLTKCSENGAVAPSSWTPEESEIESSEHQDNADVRCEPFPESVSKECEIHTDDHNYHCCHVKRDSELSTHSSLHGLYCKGTNEFPENDLYFG